MPSYKHLFFDLDHTLWDFDTNAREALIEIYVMFNLESLNVAPFELFYERYIYHNQLLWDRYHKGFITQEELKWKRMWRTLLDFKIGNEKLAREISEKFITILPYKTGLFEHTHEILTYLTAKNYQLHLITNGFEKVQWNKINGSNISQYFTHVITSEGSNSLKPKKEIFDFAIRKAGTTVKESIMLGDNLYADIQGAINAGMDNVFVNHVNAITDLKPTHIVTHLKELEKIF
ncbi:MAG: noncanonical pyrimidine nucleotidase, YjjG family [Sphingobacteriales bacterium]|nr:noncanonical pyrimidine nucleotidase, YjjG family [Sphingobacteriales bacterium]